MKIEKDIDWRFIKIQDDKPIEEGYDIDTTVSEYEISSGIKDEYGVIYTQDGEGLLKAPFDLNGIYRVKDGTIAIADRAFQGCENIESIILPDSIRALGKHSFFLCYSLKEICLPAGIKEIPSFCFMGCDNIERVILPNNLWEIHDSAFDGCRNLRDITFPTSLFKIGKSSFYKNYSLEKIIIPKSLAFLGRYAFMECNNLETVIINGNVEVISEETFQKCESLKKVEINGDTKEIGYRTFVNCSSLEEVKLPQTLLKIGNACFAGCEELSKIKIPASLEYIGECAFYECGAIKDITLPKGLQYIGSEAFNGCSCDLHILNEKYILENELLIDKNSGKIVSVIEKGKRENNLEGLKKLTASQFSKLIDGYCQGEKQDKPLIIWCDMPKFLKNKSPWKDIQGFVQILSQFDSHIVYWPNVGSPLTDKRFMQNEKGEIISIPEKTYYDFILPQNIEFDEQGHLLSRVFIHTPFSCHIGEKGLNSFQYGKMIFDNLHIPILLLYPFVFRETMMKHDDIILSQIEKYEQYICVDDE